MKYANTILGVTALALAALGLLNSRTVNRETMARNMELESAIVELEQQIRATQDFQSVLGAALPNPARPNREPESKNLKSRARWDDTLRNQGQANDNQWQEIDYLKSQRQYHKQLIDQLNTDLLKLRRENREMTQTLRAIEQGGAVVANNDFQDVKRRVDELYRRMNFPGGR